MKKGKRSFNPRFTNILDLYDVLGIENTQELQKAIKKVLTNSNDDLVSLHEFQHAIILFMLTLGYQNQAIVSVLTRLTFDFGSIKVQCFSKDASEKAVKRIKAATGIKEKNHEKFAADLKRIKDHEDYSDKW